MLTLVRASMAALLLMAGAAQAVNHAGVEFPQYVRVDGQLRPWPLHGSALMHRSFIPFYGLVLYAPREARGAEELAQGLRPVRIVLVWYANALPQDQVGDHFRKLFVQVTDEETRRTIGNRLDKFVALMPAAERGRKVVFDYSPDGGMVVTVEGGRYAHFAGIDFNRGLLSMWLGPKADAQVRAGLTTVPAP